MDVSLDALRISPKYSSRDWDALSVTAPSDWSRASEIVRDRLHGRFLRFADNWLLDPFSGFVVLSIDCLLAETIEQFRAGATSGQGKSEKYITRFLSGSRFQPAFDEPAQTSFYEDIRCGLLHQAEAKGKWLVRRNQKTMLQNLGVADGYIIDVPRFHTAVQLSLEDYLSAISHPSQNRLRLNLWKKMAHISSVRAARGLLYEAGAVAEAL